VEEGQVKNRNIFLNNYLGGAKPEKVKNLHSNESSAYLKLPIPCTYELCILRANSYSNVRDGPNNTN
jgi:hypothetical protein